MVKLSTLTVAFMGLSHVFASPIQEDFLKRAANSVITDGSSVNGKTFDFVIIGGGTAGLAAAYKLTSDSSKKVLIIEAGSDTREVEKVASLSLYGQAFGDPNLDWNFVTTNQDTAGSRVQHIHAGKGLGGSTTINGAVFTTPPLSQIDALGSLGNIDWSWDALSSYLTGFQHYHVATPDQHALGVSEDMAFHGTNGPVDIGFPTNMRKDPQELAFVSSIAEALGVPKAQDLGTSHDDFGAAYIPQFIKPGQGTNSIRISAATAYFGRMENAVSNLVTLINTRATKILWQKGTSPIVASGVEFQSQQNGPTYHVNAKQVIVAAGTLRSPKLLELSGVGDPKILNKIGVPIVVDLPGVGTNLIEQQKTDIKTGPPKDASVAPDSVNNMIAVPNIFQLMKNASDVATYIQNNIDSWAQAVVASGGSASREGLLLQYKTMLKGILENSWPIAEFFLVPSQNELLLQVWTLMSWSRGSVHATTASTWVKSAIDPKYFSVPIDMDFQVAAMRGARKTFQGQAFQKVVAGSETVPGFNVQNGGIPQGAGGGGNYGRYDRWQKYITETSQRLWHVIGTCAMMPRNLGGVVGSDFKVHGTSNVYVIDASVIPIPLSTHYTSVVYAMASKAADMISGSR